MSCAPFSATTGFSSRLFQLSLLHRLPREQFGNLDCVQRCAFQKLIAADPEANPLSRAESTLTRPTWQLFFPEARIGIGYVIELGSSTSSKPGNFARTSRARSTETGC